MRLVKIIPVYGNGWTDAAGNFVETPEPFGVHDISDAENGVVSKVMEPGHQFDKMLVGRSPRHRGDYAYMHFNVDVFTLTKDQNKQVIFSGYARIG